MGPIQVRYTKGLYKQAKVQGVRQRKIRVQAKVQTQPIRVRSISEHAHLYLNWSDQQAANTGMSEPLNTVAAQWNQSQVWKWTQVCESSHRCGRDSMRNYPGRKKCCTHLVVETTSLRGSVLSKTQQSSTCTCRHSIYTIIKPIPHV